MSIFFTKNLDKEEDLRILNEAYENVSKANIDSFKNIDKMKELNSEAMELSKNIQNALPINSELIKNSDIAKNRNDLLSATNKVADDKNNQLNKSLEETKNFIKNLDSSQNIPQIRSDLDKLQNGLKSNQSLSYEGSSVVANDTLEGRTEGMRIGGMTLLNLVKMSKGVKERVWFRNDRFSFNPVGVQTLTVLNLTSKILRVQTSKLNNEYSRGFAINANGTKVITLNSDEKLRDVLGMKENGWIIDDENQFNEFKKGCIILLGDYSNISNISYFEDIKSFGEAEQEGDKYKISILSSGKNLVDLKNILDDFSISYTSLDGGYKINGNGKLFRGLFYPKNPKKQYTLTLEAKTITMTNFRCEVVYTDGSLGSTEIIREQNKMINLTMTTRSDKEIAYFRMNWTNTGEVVLKNLQIEEGARTPYEPYKCDKKDILIKEPLRENDVLYEDNGQVKVYRDARKYVITGNEDWSQYTDNRDFTCMGFFLQLNKIFDAKLGGNFICNNFKGSDTDVFPGNITVDDEIIFVKGRSGEASPSYIKISISKSKLTTQNVEGFRAWLKANPTTIVYQLATPTVEIVENCIDIDLDTYQNKTYFNILNSLPGTLDFKVPSNIGSALQSDSRKINEINDFLNNTVIPLIIKNSSDIALLLTNNKNKLKNRGGI